MTARNISRQDAKEAYCHFDPFGRAQGKLREKSFLDPSHSLGMTGLARHLAFLAPWREDFRFTKTTGTIS
jgi:hypothetical protein